MNEASINQKQNVPPQKNATSALKSLFLKDIRLIRRPKLSNSGGQLDDAIERSTPSQERSAAPERYVDVKPILPRGL